ncbi:hypothetical protein CCACVL1_13607 [Corchorus capsularis]|uniref:MHD1 domain-containing protein n=1 Tax=Corchorus capsularis TaxID=210143 RepID=A0A1R3IAG0_COCAP|nr:hypothetical protein CCACVL1_13607 [Corchorus capsularis]
MEKPTMDNLLRLHVITRKKIRALRTRCNNLHNQLVDNRLRVASAILTGEMDRELRHMMKRSTPALEKYWGSLMNRKEILRGSLNALKIFMMKEPTLVVNSKEEYEELLLIVDLGWRGNMHNAVADEGDHAWVKGEAIGNGNFGYSSEGDGPDDGSDDVEMGDGSDDVEMVMFDILVEGQLIVIEQADAVPLLIKLPWSTLETTQKCMMLYMVGSLYSSCTELYLLKKMTGIKGSICLKQSDRNRTKLNLVQKPDNFRRVMALASAVGMLTSVVCAEIKASFCHNVTLSCAYLKLTQLCSSALEEQRVNHSTRAYLHLYQIENVSGPIILDWVIGQHAHILEWTGRALDLEEWEPLSFHQRQAASIIEDFRILEEEEGVEITENFLLPGAISGGEPVRLVAIHGHYAD